MRGAVAAAIVLALLVAGLALVAIQQPVSVDAEPAVALEQSSPAAINPFRPSARSQDPCPQPSLGGPDLTGCPDNALSGAPTIGFGDLRRIEALAVP